MPDLSIEGSHQFWSDYADQSIYRVLMMMEAVEKWTVDGDPNIESAIKQLGNELDDLEKVKMETLGHEALFISFAGHIKASRLLRLLQAVDTAHPGSASKILVFAEESTQNSTDPAGLFLRRNIIFERLRLLGRVFSPERIQSLSRILEGEHYEEEHA